MSQNKSKTLKVRYMGNRYKFKVMELGSIVILGIFGNLELAFLAEVLSLNYVIKGVNVKK